jgi:putative transposase
MPKFRFENLTCPAKTPPRITEDSGKIARNGRISEMKKTRYTEEQIIGVLKQMEAGRKVAEVAREIGVSEATLYTWKSKYGGMDVNEARRLRELEEENRRLKQLVADLSLDREALKAVIRKNGWSL